MFGMKLLLLCAACTTMQDRDEWRAIYLDGTHVGYERTRFGSDGDVMVTQRETVVRARNRQVDWHITTRSAPDGLLQQYEANLGTKRTVATFGEAQSGMRPVETVRAGRRQWTQLPEDVRSPFWFERQLAANPIPPRNRMRVTIFEDGAAVELTITSSNWHRIALPNGGRKKLLRLTITRADRPGQLQHMHMNEEGRIEVSELVISGVTFLTQLVPRSQAQTAEDARKFDIALASFVPADRSLSDGREAERAVYRITGPGQLVQTLNHQPRQLATAATDGAVEVTVTASKLTASRMHRRADDEYLRSTTLLDHRTLTVQQFAAEAAAGEYDTAAIAKKLQRTVGTLVRNRRFSAETKPASQILRSRQGDCTEHAVLLTALLRARRIPARVVVGLIYLDGRNGFGSHMWTEAMINGEWTALDATFARQKTSKQAARVPGAGYLKVAHSSLKDGETVLDAFIPVADLMTKLEIEIVDTPSTGR